MVYHLLYLLCDVYTLYTSWETDIYTIIMIKVQLYSVYQLDRLIIHVNFHCIFMSFISCIFMHICYV